MENEWMLPERLYKVLKWTGLIACPAVSVFYGTCAPLWGWPQPTEVVTTVNAFGVLIGALIGISHATKKTDGGDE
jgi:hypothetical protein